MTIFFLNFITNFELSAKCNLSYQQNDNNESLCRNNINRKSISITTLIEYGHGHFEQNIKIATFSLWNEKFYFNDLKTNRKIRKIISINLFIDISQKILTIFFVSLLMSLS